MLEPIPGGHVTFTRQSSMLFQLYKSSSSIIQMFCLSLQSHANTRDGGKFGAILCCKFVSATCSIVCMNNCVLHLALTGESRPEFICILKPGRGAPLHAMQANFFWQMVS